jgi:hypothetical protein
MRLRGYLRVLQKYGSECLIETAEEDPQMSEEALVELEQAIRTKEKYYKWEKAKWVKRKIKVKLCACGCERPVKVGSNGRLSRYHSEECKAKATRKKDQTRRAKSRAERDAERREFLKQRWAHRKHVKKA